MELIEMLNSSPPPLAPLRSPTSQHPPHENTSMETETNAKSKVTFWANKLETYLTNFTVNNSRKIYKFGAFVKCVPLELCSSDSLRVQMFPQKWRRILWHISTWLLFFMCAFKCINFFVSFPNQKMSTEMAIHIFNIIGCFLFFFFSLPLYLKPEECIFSMNQHDFIFKISPDLGMGNKHWASHPTVILAILYFSRIIISLAIGFIGLSLWVPNYSAYIYSVFPDGWKRGYVLFIICSGLELGLTVWGLAILLLFFCYWVAVVFTLNTAISELMKQKELTGSDIQAYLYLQIYVLIFNDYNRDLFVPGYNFVVTASAILFLYLTFTCIETVNIMIYMLFPACAMFAIAMIVWFCPQSSKVNIVSRQLLESLRTQKITLREHQTNNNNNLIKPGVKILPGLRMRSAIRRGYSAELFDQKRAKALRPFGIDIAFFSCYTIGTSGLMMDQLINNLLLLLSL